MRTLVLFASSLFALLSFPLMAGTTGETAIQRTTADNRPRVIVSTDIGGTDPDDLQSMVHFLLYTDVFDVEGIMSSPYGPGRREHILQVIDHYAADYVHLKAHSDRYPHRNEPRRLTRQGHRKSRSQRPFTSSSGSRTRAARRCRGTSGSS